MIKIHNTLIRNTCNKLCCVPTQMYYDNRHKNTASQHTVFYIRDNRFIIIIIIILFRNTKSIILI